MPNGEGTEEIPGRGDHVGGGLEVWQSIACLRIGK